ncbi:FAM172 family protein homolog CG10038 isoform X2 [Pieris brassicae]|uniref:FAM172 family protein homolog CG10038 isoform X2 n=1 Tax=Pieris brassicae TaxID=7116 RepID=UPI001E65FDC7|nr:FAM172 family protein homolog CG10038 isoform X2 [Pieris brassicae]
MLKKLWKNIIKTRKPYRTIKKTKEMDVRKTLHELGYDFNTGELRKMGVDGNLTDEPFQYKISSDQKECQAHYEKLGAAVTEYIYQLLQNKVNLLRLPVPTDAGENGTFVFASRGYDSQKTLMVLIQGSGAVRAGQWARSLIINNNLDMGTQIPYIQMGIKRNFGILIMNPNENYKRNKNIPQSNTSEEHAQYVWKTYISGTKAKNIVVVAHSYGGLLTVMLAQKFQNDFEKRVKAVAMTDSVHSFSEAIIPDSIRKVSINWISNSSPLDTPMKTPEFEITRLSAGHPQHEMTSYAAMDSVFKFIDSKLAS